MSLIGTVWNKVLSKYINVYLAEGGPGFRRLPEAIDQAAKDAALARLKAAFEAGKLFNDTDMGKMEQVTITNMIHPSPGDPNNHDSVQGETATGGWVKGGHVTKDGSKQTVRSSLLLCVTTS
ncbi:uncharacterized protein BDR25DRAFT_209766 [Lindgomyces ingoldianus]|uniref:Uncharacterized protein n=1 Tax=Lindgomyces ingoldianus TaxID=673940 RepID=A0ACB6RCA6_9PLEO|nr:uncharacterized protein BDR25DRAFT_209766 [Lindgomyces ingoldianus]KAF2476365.1 hypothetical protein BDR25DRAFT_209766 [Lindgomyces ingoldianus]